MVHVESYSRILELGVTIVVKAMVDRRMKLEIGREG